MAKTTTEWTVQSIVIAKLWRRIREQVLLRLCTCSDIDQPLEAEISVHLHPFFWDDVCLIQTNPPKVKSPSRNRNSEMVPLGGSRIASQNSENSRTWHQPLNTFRKSPCYAGAFYCLVIAWIASRVNPSPLPNSWCCAFSLSRNVSSLFVLIFLSRHGTVLVSRRRDTSEPITTSLRCG